MLQTVIKKARLRFATAHGDKDHTFWRNVLWFDETKIEHFGHKGPSLCLEEKGGGLQAEEHHSNREARGWQHHVMWVLCCRRDWCISQNRWLHEGGKWCGYIEATSQDISQEVKAWSQMGLPNGQQPQANFQSYGKMSKGQQSQGIEVGITKPWPQSYRKCMGRIQRVCESKEAYKPDSVTPALSGGMGQNSPNLFST